MRPVPAATVPSSFSTHRPDERPATPMQVPRRDGSFVVLDCANLDPNLPFFTMPYIEGVVPLDR